MPAVLDDVSAEILDLKKQVEIVAWKDQKELSAREKKLAAEKDTVVSDLVRRSQELERRLKAAESQGQQASKQEQDSQAERRQLQQDLQRERQRADKMEAQLSALLASKQPHATAQHRAGQENQHTQEAGLTKGATATA